MSHHRFPIHVIVALAFVAWGAAAPAAAQVSYSISDGVADLTLSIDPMEAIVFLNTFPVDPAGEYVDQVLVAYGRVGGPSTLNGRPVRILLYEDLDGGSPKNGVLLWSLNTAIANGNTNVLNVYNVPRMYVRNTLVVGFYFRNASFGSIFVGALDTTDPTFLQRSWAGYATTIDPANLEAIPDAQWGAQEDLSTPGNFRIEARGQENDGIVLSVEKLSPSVVRLTWTGSKPSYVVERASSPDFSDAQTLASGPMTSHDDPVLDDGATWFYRVR